MVNPSVVSMTGFAVRSGEGHGRAWTWEARSVNGKGLDLRFRLPEGIEGLEAAVRAEAARRFTRGNVTLSLRLDRAPDAAAARIDPGALDRALDALVAIGEAAGRRGLALRPVSAAEILTLRGVTTADSDSAEAEPLRAALLADLAAVLDALADARAAEGRALHEVLSAQVDRIDHLAAEAAAAAAARAPLQAEALGRSIARLLAQADSADAQRLDPQRLAQELALLAVKSDVTEELDRLRAHVVAARALLAGSEPVGRRFDFLSQEFNREANTLAAKSGAPELTRIALDLKVAIDQMREQVQNVE